MSDGAGVEMTPFERDAEAADTEKTTTNDATEDSELTAEEKAEIAKNKSWFYGLEDNHHWNEYLHSYQKTWIKLIFVTTIPSVLTFAIGICISIAEGGWYAVAFGALYEPKNGQTVFYWVPSILKNHFWGAAAMLPLLIAQIILAGLAVWSPEGSSLRAKRFGRHAAFGVIPAGAVIFAVTLGTLALAFCDFQPKRGSETAFFVLVGIAILWSLLKGLIYVQKGKTGLHMQYMFYACYGVSSPGWNRIVTVLIRASKGALFDEHLKSCFFRQAFRDKGYYFSWSFLAGEIWLLSWWLLPFSPLRAPFFKKFSLGFFLLWFQAMIMIACFIELIAGGADTADIACNTTDLVDFADFSLAVKTQGLYSLNFQYGLCAPADVSDFQGPSGANLRDPTYISPDGEFDVPDNFLAPTSSP